MAASYPAAVKTFATRSAGQTIFPSHINDLQDEVNAIEDGLLNGTAPVGASNATFNRVTVSSLCAVSSLSVSAGASFSSVYIAGNINIVGESTFFGGVVASSNVAINGGLSVNGQLQLNGIQNSTMGGGDFNNLAIASTAFHLRIDCSTLSTLVGIAGPGGTRRLILITNVGAAELTISNNGAGSISTNRFFFAASANSTLGSGASILAIYDGTGWRGLYR